MNLDPQILSNIIMGGAAWGAAFLVALWFSMIIWTYRDIRSRARDPLLRILAVIIVALLFLPGIVVYLILRPPSTLEDEYQHSLEEEALLQSIEEVSLCPGCGRRTKEAWMVCPTCHTKLKKPCHVCQKPIDLAWNLCPYCGTPAPGVRKEDMIVVDVTEDPLPEDDILSDDFTEENFSIEERLNLNDTP